MIRSAVPWLILAAGVAACGEAEFELPDPQQRVDTAHTRYSPTLFDTVTWGDDEARGHSGNAVFAAHCRVCHGSTGEGGTDYARGRGLSVLSLVEPDWSLGLTIDSVRHRVYVGHADGMPTWGVAGITPREVDAASFYILEMLRPEVLSN